MAKGNMIGAWKTSWLWNGRLGFDNNHARLGTGNLLEGEWSNRPICSVGGVTRPGPSRGRGVPAGLGADGPAVEVVTRGPTHMLDGPHLRFPLPMGPRQLLPSPLINLFIFRKKTKREPVNMAITIHAQLPVPSVHLSELIPMAKLHHTRTI